MTVTKPEKPMVEMVLISLGHADAFARRTSDDGENQVGERNAEQEERDDEWRKEEKDLTGYGLIDAATNGGGTGCKQQSEQQRSPVTHKGLGGMHVEGKKPNAHTGGDDCQQRSWVQVEQNAVLCELEGIDKEAAGGDCDDASRQTVKAIDEVDRIRHDEEPEHGYDDRQIR